MGKHVNVDRDENGLEIREKKSKQYSKTELEDAIRLFDNDKTKMAEYLGLGSWSLREQLKRNGLNIDKRGAANKKRGATIPQKEDLEKLYLVDKLSINDIASNYQVSHVTVRKWIKDYDIRMIYNRTDEKIPDMSVEVTNNTLSISPWLTEINLEDVIKFIFNIIPERQFSIGRLRIDYKFEVDGKIIMVEYNGPHHYQKTKTICRDNYIRKYCKDNGYILIEIPYFIQLTPDNLLHYFSGIDRFSEYIDGKDIVFGVPSGFISEDTVLPCDFCLIGLSRYMRELSELPQDTRMDIFISLKNRTGVDRLLLDHFQEYLDHYEI